MAPKHVDEFAFGVAASEPFVGKRGKASGHFMPSKALELEHPPF